jgi:tetratricopeptide (TPR) repeat protein
LGEEIAEVSPLLLILLLGIGYTLVFGSLGLVRHEGLSNRFALEGLAITFAALALGWGSGHPPDPILFLIAIYVLTMRVRLLVDLGTMLAGRGYLGVAERIYNWASLIWPDEASRAVVKINQGALFLRQGRLEKAVQVLEDVLARGEESRLGIKYEAAGRYNLGVAYRRVGRDTAAIMEFNKVVGLMPGSVFAIRAEQALQAIRHKPSRKAKPSPVEQPGDTEA